MRHGSALVLGVLSVLVVSTPAPAQSLLVEASKKAQDDHAKGDGWPVPTAFADSSGQNDPIDPAEIDKSKFDKLYEAGKAVSSAQYLSAVGVTPRELKRLLLVMDTERKIVLDKATTKSEKALAGRYALAQIEFDLALTYYQQAVPGDNARWSDTFTKATGTLDAANDIYLGKKSK